MISRSQTVALTVVALAAGLQACGPDASNSPAVQPPGASNLVSPATQPALSNHVSTLAQGLAGQLENRTIAVLDFPDLQGRVTQLGSLMSEQLTTELVRSGKGRVLERKQVVQVLEELNLRKADLTTSEVSMAAQQLGADVIIVGTASVVGRMIEVNARAVNVAEGNLLAADRFEFVADAGLRNLAGQMSVGAVGQPGGNADMAPSPAPPVLDATFGPLSATIRECRAASSELTCTAVFMSATVDANVQVSQYDDQNGARDEGGNPYRFTTFTFGSENSAHWNTLLVAKEPTPAQFTITGVPITMSRLTRVAVGVSLTIGEREASGTLIFRNVPIVR